MPGVSERGHDPSRMLDWSPRELFGTIVDAKRWGRNARSWRGGLALLFICLAVYLPGFVTIPTIDRDEARFAQASRQMSASEKAEDWIIPKVQDRPRLNKPPLIYWLQSSAVRAGDALGVKDAADLIWLYRLPSLLAAIIAVLATWRLGTAMFDPRAGWLGALLLAVCPIVMWESKQARADMVLLAATTVAQWALFRLWHVDHDSTKARKTLGHWRIVFWGAMIVGVLVKGPLTPLICSLTLLSLGFSKRSRGVLKRTWPVLGSLAVLAAIGVWAVLVMRQVGAQSYFDIIVKETLGRTFAAKEGHSGPPGYHLLLLSVLFWPGSLVTGQAMVRAWKQGFGPTEARGIESSADKRTGNMFQRVWGAVNRRVQHGAKGRQAEVFLLAWVLVPWLVFEFTSTKLPHYVMPLYPAIALISARAIFTASCGVMDSVPKLVSRIGYVAWAIIGGILSIMPLFVWWYFGVETTYPQFAIALLPVLLMVITLVIAWKGIFRGIRGGKNQGKFLRAQAVSALGAGLTWAILCGMVLPSTRSLWVSAELRTLIERVDPLHARPVATVQATEDSNVPRDKKLSFVEDSLIFEMRGRSERIDEIGLEKWLKDHPDGVFILPKVLADRKTGIMRIGEVSGFNYSLGNRVYLTVCQLPPSQEHARQNRPTPAATPTAIPTATADEQGVR